MSKYAKLKNGEIMVVWSDNMDDETMNLYHPYYDGWFDPEVNTAHEFPYSEIVGIDSNFEVIMDM